MTEKIIKIVLALLSDSCRPPFFCRHFVWCVSSRFPPPPSRKKETTFEKKNHGPCPRGRQFLLLLFVFCFLLSTNSGEIVTMRLDAREAPRLIFRVKQPGNIHVASHFTKLPAGLWVFNFLPLFVLMSGRRGRRGPSKRTAREGWKRGNPPHSKKMAISQKTNDSSGRRNFKLLSEPLVLMTGYWFGLLTAKKDCAWY